MMFIKKKMVLLLCLVFAITAVAGCGNRTAPDYSQAQAPAAQAERAKVRVATLMGPTGMGMVELMDKNELGKTALDYEFLVMGSPDDLVGKILSGEVDVAAVPTNLASVLYNRTNGAVQLAAVNTLGVLYLLENGDRINSIQDLKGKTVNTTGKGASPDFIFRYILQENGLVPDQDVMLDFRLQHSELAAALAAGDVNIGLLPEPHVTVAMARNENLRIALNVSEEWTKVAGGELVMGGIIVQRDFAENNKEVLNTFLDEYQQSVAFVNSNIEASAELMAKHNILPSAAIAKKAIPTSNIVFIDAMDARAFLEDFYQILYNFEPKSVGGKLADEGFYYKR